MLLVDNILGKVISILSLLSFLIFFFLTLNDLVF